MYNVYNSPDRVTKLQDGSYYWRCEIGKDYERRAYRQTMIICSAIAVFIVVYGGILSMMYHSGFIITVGCAVFLMVLASAICFGLDRLPGKMKENYRMTEEYVESGSGKSRAAFAFKRARKVIVTNRYIELKGRFGGPRVYVPEEDMPFVKGHILCRIPGDAEVRVLETV